MMKNSKLDRLLAKFGIINAVLVFISAVAITFMSFMIVLDVLLRYVFNAPLPASVEMSQLIETYVVFLPFAFTLSIGRHVRVTLVTSRLPTSARILCDLFTYLVGFVFFVFACYYSFLEAWHSLMIKEIMFAAIRLPWWVGKFAMTIGMFFISLQYVLHFLESLREMKEST